MRKVVELDLADLEKVQGGATIRAGATPQEAETLRRQTRLGNPVDPLGRPLQDLLDPLHAAARPPLTTIPRPASLGNRGVQQAMDLLNRAAHANNNGGTANRSNGTANRNAGSNNGGSHAASHNTSHNTDNDTGSRAHSTSHANSRPSTNNSGTHNAGTHTDPARPDRPDTPLPRPDPRKEDVPLPRSDPRKEDTRTDEQKEFDRKAIVDRLNGLPGPFGEEPLNDPSKAKSDAASSQFVPGDDRAKTQEQINRELLAGYQDTASPNYMDYMNGTYVPAKTEAEALAQGQMIARQLETRPGGLAADPEYATGLYLQQQDSLARALGENIPSVIEQDQREQAIRDGNQFFLKDFNFDGSGPSMTAPMTLDRAIQIENDAFRLDSTPRAAPSFVDPDQSVRGLGQTVTDASLDVPAALPDAVPAEPAQRSTIIAGDLTPPAQQLMDPAQQPTDPFTADPGVLSA